jgi:hypothetical protein
MLNVTKRQDMGKGWYPLVICICQLHVQGITKDNPSLWKYIFMITRLSVVLIAWIAPSIAFSQSEKSDDYLDGTFSFGKQEGSLAIHYTHLWKFGKAHKLAIGLGARYSSYVGANQYYITAPAELTSEGSSPLIIFKENIIGNIDSLLVKSPFVNSINLSINIQYQISSKLTGGFNIDALGFSFGNKKQGNYINGSTGRMTSGKPTAFNVLLVSDNDRGSLNSELFLQYKLNSKWGVKLGATFLFTEYTTDTKVQTFPKENDRFRNKSLMLGLGVTYQIK